MSTQVAKPNDPPIWICYLGVKSRDDFNRQINAADGEAVWKAIVHRAETFIGPDAEDQARAFAATLDEPAWVDELMQPPD